MLLSSGSGYNPLARSLSVGQKVNDSLMWRKEKQASQLDAHIDKDRIIEDSTTDDSPPLIMKKRATSKTSIHKRNDYEDELLHEASKHEKDRSEASDFQFSVSVVGDASSYKSKIIDSECGGIKRSHHMTGKIPDIDFKRNTYTFKGKSRNLECDVDYWISNSSSNNLAMTAKLMARSAATIYVFNVEDVESFENISQWIQIIKSQAPESLDSSFKRQGLILAENFKLGMPDQPENQKAPAEKSEDLEDKDDLDSAEELDTPKRERLVSEEKGLELAQKHGLLYYECSSDNPDTFKKLFKSLAHLIIEPFLDLDKRTNPAVLGLRRGGVKVNMDLTPHQRLQFHLALAGSRPSKYELTTKLDWDI